MKIASEHKVSRKFVRKIESELYTNDGRLRGTKKSRPRFVSPMEKQLTRRDLFEGKSRAGPWHAIHLRRGDEFVNRLGAELISKYPPETTLVHAFTARMIVARRVESNRSSSSLL